MKKLIAVLLVFAVIGMLSACTNANNSEKQIDTEANGNNAANSAVLIWEDFLGNWVVQDESSLTKGSFDYKMLSFYRGSVVKLCSDYDTNGGDTTHWEYKDGCVIITKYYAAMPGEEQADQEFRFEVVDRDTLRLAESAIVYVRK